jgi:transketolase
MHSVAAAHAKAVHLGKLCVRMTTRAGSGHPSSGLSLAHIVTDLMYRTMRYDPHDPRHPAADRLVLSEGHAVPIVYAAYADLQGVVGRGPAPPRTLQESDVDGLRALDSVLDGHPNPAEGMPFFDAATGSLGQGLSVAAGLALGARLDASPRRVFVVIGDGESREGQIWEALDFIVDHQLASVSAVFNCNGQGQAGNVSPQQSPERLAAKLNAFGWEVVTIDGHDPQAVARAFDAAAGGRRPTAIIARTIKGWGAPSLQQGNWHGKPCDEAGLPVAMEGLDQTARSLGADAQQHLPGPPAPPPIPDGTRRPRPHAAEVRWPGFEESMTSAGLGAALAKRQLATRRAFGAALKTAGDLMPQVVCLDGDVSNSTFSEIFAKVHPERFFECKIAEQNMISVGAGLSAAGFIPFVNSFAKFIARGYDQVEMASISRANLKLVGSHAGISLAADGPSQMALPDVAYFRAFTTVRDDERSGPICWIFHPADAVAAYHCTRRMLEHHGLCYMRTHRPDVPLLYPPDTAFEPGGLHVPASGDDLAIVSAGFMVHTALRAAAELAHQNVRAAVIDAYSLPLNVEKLVDSLRRAGRRALVVEDNYGGGLGAAVAEVAARFGGLRVHTLTCQRIPKSARTADEILDYCGVGPRQIADHALAMMRD